MLIFLPPVRHPEGRKATRNLNVTRLESGYRFARTILGAEIPHVRSG